MERYTNIHALFFFYVSSGYSCSICSYTRTLTQHVHTTHTTRVQTDLQLHLDLKTASFLRSPKSTDFASDGHVTIPLWLHAWEADAWNWSKRRLFLFLGKNPRCSIRFDSRNRTRVGALHDGRRSPLRYARVRNIHADRHVTCIIIIIALLLLDMHIMPKVRFGRWFMRLISQLKLICCEKKILFYGW
jgi:hypothetical protein